MRRQYQRKKNQFVRAVQLALETDGFVYRKWGAEQRCKAGDWLVDNDGDVYTIAEQEFARTYREIEPARYWKSTPIWAERAAAAGSVQTLEGTTHYEAGDYIVANEEAGQPTYAVSAKKFEAMYEPAS
jgi:hypothetical protein